jgi:hypothetical protein
MYYSYYIYFNIEVNFSEVLIGSNSYYLLRNKEIALIKYGESSSFNLIN